MLPKFTPGDLLFFYGHGWESRTIELATRGPSHVGIVFNFKNQNLLLESTTLCDWPCEIRGAKINGVQAHEPLLRATYYGGPAYHVPIRARLYASESNHLTAIALDEFLGQPYDLAGAIESGPHWLKPASWLYPDLGSIFCSALAAHLLMRVNRLNWDNPKKFNPADLLRAVLSNATHRPPVKIDP